MIRPACSRPALSLAALVLASGANTALAQVRVLLADRTAEKIWSLTDRNADGRIDASEIGVFFDGANLAGTPGVRNPNMIGTTRDGRVFVGDQDNAARHWLVLIDRDHNGNAQNTGESLVGVSALNAGGFSFAFPTGFAQDQAGRVHLVNAGNGFGPDQIFVVADATSDDDFQDADEVFGLVTINGFGANGPLSPQEIVFGSDGALYLRNSTANNHGIFRLQDLDGSGRIDQANEYVAFWGLGNAPGIVPSAGFAIDVDPTRERSFFTLQTATGGVDQLIRATDLNANGHAQDPDESLLVFSTAEAGFTGIDAMSLPDGTVLISDNSGNRIIALRDLDGDGRFTTAGERSDFLPSGSPGILAARAIAILPCPGDYNRDLRTDPDDLSDFIGCYFQAPPCPDADFDRSGVADPDDLSDFIAAYFSPC
jgi:hypothetical protein